MVRGPGGPTGDRIPAWVSSDEFISRAKSVSYYGPRFYYALNEMRIPRDAIAALFKGMRGFAGGGQVRAAPDYSPTMAMTLRSIVIPAAVAVPVPAFADGGLVEALTMPLVQQQPRLRTERLVSGTPGNTTGAPVHLHLNGREYRLMGRREVVDQLTHEWRRAELLSAGRMPGY
jgi:hypothetical protein